MELNALLLEKKSIILNKWFNLILDTYPPDTASFIKNQRDQFANPVGHTIIEGIEGIFNEIISDIDFKKVTPYVENIIKIRAIQDFTPSQAIGFILLLKNVIREEVGEISGQNMFNELLTLESKIDDIAMVSFDVYMKCRERIYELRTNEVNNWTYRLLQQANSTDKVK